MDGTKGTKAVPLCGGEDGKGGGVGGGSGGAMMVRLFIIIALFNAAFCRSIANRCISMPKLKWL